MILRLYTIFDTKVQAYLRLFPLRSNGEATRMFADMANDPNNQIGQHPEDYVLYCVGEFDDARGIITAFTVHETLCKAIEMVNVPVQQDGPRELEVRDRFEQECG